MLYKTKSEGDPTKLVLDQSPSLILILPPNENERTPTGAWISVTSKAPHSHPEVRKMITGMPTTREADEYQGPLEEIPIYLLGLLRNAYWLIAGIDEDGLAMLYVDLGDEQHAGWDLEYLPELRENGVRFYRFPEPIPFNEAKERALMLAESELIAETLGQK